MKIADAGRAILMLTVVLPAALPCAAAAQSPDTTWHVGAGRASTPPRIDGRDDDAWTAAPWITTFLQYRPGENVPPTVATAYKVMYDDHNLYVLVRAFDPHPDSITHAVVRRDSDTPCDQIGVILDSYHDHRTGFEFVVNPDGVKADFAIYDDSTEDVAWDGVWSAAASVDSLGWIAEFRIPFSQLRYADAATHTFGFAVWRVVQRTREFVAWPLYRPSKAGLSSQLGHLVNLGDIASSRALEFTPYAIVRNTSRPDAGGYARHGESSFGGSVKYSLSPSLTLDGTINPDFGQVDADPSVVNLTAFETFLAERRPFFLEGVRLYQFPINCSSVVCNNEGLFYSRRIGRAPQLAELYGDASSPGGTPIAAAVKVTGRSRGGLSAGVLDAATNPVTGTAGRTIEPFTNYALARAQQDLSNGRGSFGIIATAVVRDVDQWSAPLLRRTAYVGGPEFRYEFGAGQYELAGSATVSRVGGSRAAITATQLDEVHQFQRPDDPGRLDSTRTTLSGTAQEVRFGKYGGGLTRFQAAFQQQSPGYEVNDLGYLQRADERTWSGMFALVFGTPHGFYRRAQLTAAEWSVWNWSGLLIQNAVGVNGHVVLKNNGSIEIGANVDQLAGSACDRCARGGPAVRSSTRLAPVILWSGDPRRVIVPSAKATLEVSDGGRSRTRMVGAAATVRPSPALQVAIDLSLGDNTDNTQWYANVADSANGLHYLFARLHQRTGAVTIRGSVALSRDLTFELYTQLFASAGTYADVRELSATPRAASYDARFQPYAPPPGQPTGFDIRQVRANSVLRWEYRPGSTLFVVWTHARDGFDPADPGRSWWAELRSALGLHPNNTFLIKAAYWIGR